jgi:hypothetical protein
MEAYNDRYKMAYSHIQAMVQDGRVLELLHRLQEDIRALNDAPEECRRYVPLFRTAVDAFRKASSSVDIERSR